MLYRDIPDKRRRNVSPRGAKVLCAAARGPAAGCARRKLAPKNLEFLVVGPGRRRRLASNATTRLALPTFWPLQNIAHPPPLHFLLISSHPPPCPSPPPRPPARPSAPPQAMAKRPR